MRWLRAGRCAPASVLLPTPPLGEIQIGLVAPAPLVLLLLLLVEVGSGPEHQDPLLDQLELGNQLLLLDL